MTYKPIIYGIHAEKRLRERDVTRSQVQWLLSRGEREAQHTIAGEQRWACSGHVGKQEVSVVFVEDAKRIEVITVIVHN